MSDHTKARLQDTAPDNCPRCGSKQQYETKLLGPIVVYECGSSRIKNGHYVMCSDICRIKHLETQLKFAEESLVTLRKERDSALDGVWRVMSERDAISKELAETEEELTAVKTLLVDILPLAMGASCRYSDHPEADIGQHCCDWGPIVDRICVALGRGGEVPATMTHEREVDKPCVT